MEVLFPLLVRRFLFRCFVVVLCLRFWWNFINIIDVRAGKMSWFEFLFAVPTFLVKRMHRAFAMGTLLRKPPARTTPKDRLLISRAFLLCTHVNLVTQESQLWSCLRKCKWNANRYHNDVHCTYCKHRTKQSISVIESPLHSCWDKITVKNRKGGFLDARGGVPIPLEPSPGHAPDLFPAHRCPSVIKFKIRLEYASVNRSNVLLISKAYFPAKKMNWL